MNKKVFGTYFYYFCVILCVALLVLALVLFPVKDLEGDALVTAYTYRYLVIFGCLTFLIPTGCLVKEVCSGKYDKKIVIRKALVVVLGTIVGVLCMIFIDNFALKKMLTFAGALVLVTVAAPSYKENR